MEGGVGGSGCGRLRKGEAGGEGAGAVKVGKRRRRPQVRPQLRPGPVRVRVCVGGGRSGLD